MQPRGQPSWTPPFPNKIPGAFCIHVILWIANKITWHFYTILMMFQKKLSDLDRIMMALLLFSIASMTLSRIVLPIIKSLWHIKNLKPYSRSMSNNLLLTSPLMKTAFIHDISSALQCKIIHIKCCSKFFLHWRLFFTLETIWPISVEYEIPVVCDVAEQKNSW